MENIENKKFPHYMVVSVWDKEKFQNQVNNCIKAGYRPYGNLICNEDTGITSGCRYVQAMMYFPTKEE